MLEKIIQTFFGKKDFHLDQSIPKSYLIGLSFKYIFSLLRGNWNKLFLGESGHRIFIEKKVKLINRKKIFLGENVRIGKNTVINAISYNGVILADNVKLGKSNQLLVTGSLQAIGKGIKIGKNCWIGSGVVFLDGATVGDGCVIAANAVVTKEFPNNVIIGGVPARLIKQRGSK